MLSDSQILHRQYLESPVWQAKREEAFACHGHTCQRCKGDGGDIHHKTYARVGGAERMSDLEVLCRPCHEAHHRVERALKTQRTKVRRGNRKPRIHERALRAYLTQAQRGVLKTEFGLCDVELNLKIMDRDGRICKRAAQMVGCSHVHSKRQRR